MTQEDEQKLFDLLDKSIEANKSIIRTQIGILIGWAITTIGVIVLLLTSAECA